MAHGVLGVLFLAALILGLSVLFHRTIVRPFIATALTAVVAAIAFQTIAPALTGYEDPFFPMGLMLCAAYGLVGSFIVGKVMRAFGWSKGRPSAT